MHHLEWAKYKTKTDYRVTGPSEWVITTQVPVVIYLCERHVQVPRNSLSLSLQSAPGNYVNCIFITYDYSARVYVRNM